MNLKTRLRSAVAQRLSSERVRQRAIRRARFRRRLRREPPRVEYFHQADDPFSKLTAQKLDALRGAYTLPFIEHPVSGPSALHQGDSSRFGSWAEKDASSIAPHFGVDPNTTNATAAPTEAQLAAGDALQRKLGHYLGAMFYFDGEWFWGLDRLHLLERRLTDEGFARNPGQLCVPLPEPTRLSGGGRSHITLEYFPSLRSPYTAIGHARVLDLIERSGVTVELRPVMPMLMRGVTAPMAKQRWIISDAGREGRFWGSPLGRICDPFGEPVKRAFALYPGAEKLGKAMSFVTEYLKGAWQDGIDITGDAGLQRVATNAGIDWAELVEASAGEDWSSLLERNVADMEAAGLWGVPSFRMSGGDKPPFACWGQDRLWLVEHEIGQRG